MRTNREEKKSDIGLDLGSFLREGSLEGRVHRVEELAREVDRLASPVNEKHYPSPFAGAAYAVRSVDAALQVARAQGLRMSLFPAFLQLLALPRLVDELNRTRLWPRMPITRGTVESLLRAALEFEDAAWLEGHLRRVDRMYGPQTPTVDHVPWRNRDVDFPLSWEARLLPGRHHTPTPWQRTVELGMWGPKPPEGSHVSHGLRERWTAEVFTPRRLRADFQSREADDLPTRQHVMNPLNLDLGDGLACRICCAVERASVTERGRLERSTKHPGRMLVVLSWAHRKDNNTGYAPASWGRPPKINKDETGHFIPLKDLVGVAMTGTPAMWDSVPAATSAPQVALLMAVQWARATAPNSGPHLPLARGTRTSPGRDDKRPEWSEAFSEAERVEVLKLVGLCCGVPYGAARDIAVLDARMLDLVERFHGCETPLSLEQFLSTRGTPMVAVPTVGGAESVAVETTRPDSGLGVDRQKLIELVLRALGADLPAVRERVREGARQGRGTPPEFHRLQKAVARVASEHGLDPDETSELQTAVFDHLRQEAVFEELKR